MKTISLGFCTIVCAALLTPVGATAQIQAPTGAAPVPQAIRDARKIFVSNAGADSGLFPSPFRDRKSVV